MRDFEPNSDDLGPEDHESAGPRDDEEVSDASPVAGSRTRNPNREWQLFLVALESIDAEYGSVIRGCECFVADDEYGRVRASLLTSSREHLEILERKAELLDDAAKSSELHAIVLTAPDGTKRILYVGGDP